MAGDAEGLFLRYVKRALQDEPEDINEVEERGFTLLTHACEKGFLKGATYLLDQGADVEASNIFGERPLQVASRCGQVDLVALLLSRGAKASESGLTDCAPAPLVLATLGRHVGVLRALLEAGVDVEEAGSNGGRTALWWACSRGFDDVVTLLLQAHANARSTCTSGDTALQAARDARSHKCVALLQEAQRAPVLEGEEQQTKAIVGQQQQEEEGQEKTDAAEEETMDVDTHEGGCLKKAGEEGASMGKDEGADLACPAPDLTSTPREAVASGEGQMEAGGEKADTEGGVEGQPESQK